MRKAFHIALLLLVVLAGVVSCRGPKRIPRKEMEEIFYLMFLQDQQIKQTQALRKQADTMLVYEGIFEAYGYDTDDYLHSLQYYLEEPEKMEKVMDAVADRLEKESGLTQKAIDLERWRKKLMGIYLLPYDTSRAPKQGPRLVDTLKVRFDGDSVYLHKVLDSLMLLPQDSLIFYRDSLPEPADTLAVPADTLLTQRDSL